MPRNNVHDASDPLTLTTGLDLDTIVFDVLALADPDRMRACGDFRETYRNDEWGRANCKVDPFKVLATGTKTRFTGSAARGINGDNMSPLDWAAVGPTLVERGRRVGLNEEDVLRAQLRRLDIGTNIVTEEDPLAYTEAMETPMGMMRRELGPASVEFSTRKRGGVGVAAYDKGRQARSSGQTIPAVHRGRSLLRLEVRLRSVGAIKREFGRSLTVADLADPAFLDEARECWHYWTSKVAMRRALRIGRPKTMGQLRDALALLMIEALGGRERLCRTVDALQSAGHIDRHQAYGMRAWIRELTRHPRLTAETDIAEEFRRAVLVSAGIHEA